MWNRRASLITAMAWALTAGLLAGCAGGGGPLPEARQPESAVRQGSRVVALEFVEVHENTAKAGYYPLERVAGCEYAADGTLIFCDQSRGKVYGLDPVSRNWYEFSSPMSRPYRPRDVRVDGFKVLVLDSGGGSIYRYDLSGSYQDRLVDVERIDPSAMSRAVAFDVDRDGRLCVADEAQQQLLLLDAFMALNMRLGEPGRSDDQFGQVSGLTFLPDGSILAADAGNRRLSWYGRLGFFEKVIGGDFDPGNPFFAPEGLDCDRFGNVFVADAGSGRIHVLDARLRPVFSAGDEFPLRGTLTVPVDVAVGPDDLLAVTDQARSAILVYRIIYE
jgi:sugar lactone lactonase YvrE